MDRLNETGLGQAVIEAAAAGKRVLGVCLGMQILLPEAKNSGTTQALGLIEGDVKRLKEARKIRRTGRASRTWGGAGFPGPASFLKPKAWTNRQAGETYFYFVHSFGVQCSNAGDLAGTIIGKRPTGRCRHRPGQCLGLPISP